MKFFRSFLNMLINTVVLGFADQFTTNGTDNFAGGRTEIIVNGTTKNTVPVAGKTLGTVIREQAQYYGLRTFSVYADGRKADTTDAANGLQCVAKKLELVAKDARGSSIKINYDVKHSWDVEAADATEEITSERV